MKSRTIAMIQTATDEKVGSFSIKNVLPTQQLRQIDPFLLIHHLPKRKLLPIDQTRIPPHPHAGFEVATYLLDGEFFHRDSRGNNQVARGGDMNWMSSGSGITHSEGPSESFLKQGGGDIQLLQVWINLPAAHKKDTPSFRHIGSDQFPVLEKPGLWARVLLGSWEGLASPLTTQTPLFWYHIRIAAGTSVSIPVQEGHNAGAYLLRGRLKVDGKEATSNLLLAFASDGAQLELTAADDTELIVFGGAPIGEKVVSYGPFVMNSFEEIQHAIADYEHGRMGVLDY
jgi:redox-sensitive bicupin YhaK (pirin superfamily)